MDFPTLSRRPTSEKKMPIDNSIKHESEDNHIRRRPRNSRVRYKWEVSYDYLHGSDGTGFINFYKSVNTYLSFNWTDRDGITHEVLFDEPIQWTEQVDNLFKIETFTLVEV